MIEQSSEIENIIPDEPVVSIEDDFEAPFNSKTDAEDEETFSSSSDSEDLSEAGAGEEEVFSDQVGEGDEPFDFSSLEEEVFNSKKELENNRASIAEFSSEDFESAKPAGDGKLRNFDDIFSSFDVGNGEIEVYVERKSPRLYKGKLISGIQKPIIDPMTHQRFADLYGSGSYSLTVYGPNKRKTLDAEGNLKRHALSKPIKIEIPDPFGENPPNPEMAAVGSAESENMDIRQGRRFGATNEADAAIHESSLEHQDRQEERRIRILEQERERAEERRRERESELKEQQNSTHDMMRELLDRKDRDMENLRNRSHEDMNGIASIISAIRPESNGNENERLYAEISEVRRQASEENNRLRDEHRHEMERLYTDKERTLREERERAEREVTLLREMHRKEIDDIRRHSQDRLDDERRQHDRDLKAVKEGGNLKDSTLQESFNMQLSVKDAELQRVQTENKRLQAELDNEKNKSLADRVGEFTSAAEALGFNKDEGGGATNWKNALGDAAVGLLGKSPALISGIASSLQANKNQASPNPMVSNGVPAMGAPNPALMTPGFAIEGVDVDLQQSPTAMSPDYSMEIPSISDQPAPERSAPGQSPIAPVSQEPPKNDNSSKNNPASPEFPVQDISTSAESSEMNISDQQIIEFSPMFREGLTKGVSPEVFAADIKAQLGPIMTQALLNDLSVKRISEVLASTPEGSSDPLVMRGGQQFLEKVWSALSN